MAGSTVWGKPRETWIRRGERDSRTSCLVFGFGILDDECGCGCDERFRDSLVDLGDLGDLRKDFCVSGNLPLSPAGADKQ